MTPSGNKLLPALGLFSATMLVVGNIIGIGIFVTPGSIASRLPAPGLIFTAWIIGAFLAFSGALAYAELGAAFPVAGGNYVFLREAYSPLWGFLYGWTASLITQPGTMAVLAIGFTQYAGIPEGLAAKAVAVGLILFFAFLNYLGIKVGAGTLSAITLLKVLAMGVLVGAGALVGRGSLAHFSPWWPVSGGSWFSLLATALIPVMYTYSGWNATVYVGSEVRRPERTIPLSLLLGTALTACIYLAMNAIYLYALPVDQMKNVVAVAAGASSALFGPSAAHVISLLIALSVLGCLNATALTAPRIPFAMAQDGYFFKGMGHVHPRFHTPAHAIWFVSLWACVLVLSGTFDQLLTYVTLPSLLMNTLTVIALFVLRIRRPEMPRPYRAWGYPVVPAFFVLMIAWITLNVLREEPREALAGLGIVSLGIPLFLYGRYWRREPAA